MKKSRAYEEGKITQEKMNKECKVLDFLGTCSDEDICKIVDSSAVNDILKAYTELACKEANISEADTKKVLNGLRRALDDSTAYEALKKTGWI